MLKFWTLKWLLIDAKEKTGVVLNIIGNYHID